MDLKNIDLLLDLIFDTIENLPRDMKVKTIEIEISDNKEE